MALRKGWLETGKDTNKRQAKKRRRKGIIRTVVATMESSTELRKQDREKQ
jgi:hypothetical protein